MKKQIIIIHGGGTFASYKDYIIDLSYPRQELPVLSLKTHRDELPRHPISTDLVV